MQLGKSLLGGMIGAAAGIGLLLVVYRVFGSDGFWLAIPLAIGAGSGVRLAMGTNCPASYLRGATTAILAIAAFIGWYWLAAGMTNARASARVLSPNAAPHSLAGPEIGDENNKVAANEASSTPVLSDLPGMRRQTAAKTMSLWDMLCLGLAALIAYEMGRGSGMPAPAIEPDDPAPTEANPSA